MGISKFHALRQSWDAKQETGLRKTVSGRLKPWLETAAGTLKPWLETAAAGS
jgi:hypothetical protein